MIDLIRARAVPANIMQSAARGALSIPGSEMIEILVHLAGEPGAFLEQARLTLATWDETAARAAAADPATPKAVLDYFVAPGNFRPALIDALLENPAISEDSLSALGTSLGADQLDAVLRSERARRSQKILASLAANPHLTSVQSSLVGETLGALTGGGDPTRKTSALEPAEPAGATASAAAAAKEKENGKDANDEKDEKEEKKEGKEEEDEVAVEELSTYLTANAKEIAAENEKPFQPIGGVHEELAAIASTPEPAGEPEPTEVPPAPARPARRKPAPASRGSALQRISHLDVTGRIQLAIKGSKEERSLLVRDGTKIVSLAVLESPKISDGEVEAFAGQKNVLEAVLRAIPMKRRFMKQYGIVRALVFNPRTPIDVSLTLVKNLQTTDLKHLSGNKEVSETVRKIALRTLRQKKETKG
jgi:hypothetical protein